MGNPRKTNSKLIIIKLGGSIVTFKTSATPRARIPVIKQLAKEIYQIYGQGYKIILVHGAGSFGHPLAKKYNLTRGLINKDSQIGFALTAQAMTRLNDLIVKIMNNHNIPAVGLSPRSFITQTNGNFNPFSLSPIQDMLSKNLVPVLHGDPVLDKKLGCSILSGDVIISYLAKKLGAKKIIFLTDVDGIFDDDPKTNPKANFIPVVTNENLKQVLAGLKKGKRDDVTGEMAGKILELQKYLRNVNVVIANGLKENSLSKLIEPEIVYTKILFS